MRHIKLFLCYVWVGIKTQSEYRIDFLIGLLSTALSQTMTVLFISIVFQKLTRIEGWSFHEVLLMYGLITTARFLAGVFLNMPWHLGGAIRYGMLDIVLVRPAAPLLQLIGNSSVQLYSMGNALVGAAAVVIVLVVKKRRKARDEELEDDEDADL